MAKRLINNSSRVIHLECPREKDKRDDGVCNNGLCNVFSSENSQRSIFFSGHI